ncbi:MAG: EamA family transporter [Ferrovibrionaceae bacterium]
MPELFALGTALCIALSSMLSAELAGRIGVVTMTRWRQLVVTTAMVGLTTAVGGWAGLQPWHLVWLAISSITGIIIAETALNAAIFDIGPRPTMLVFSLNAPMAALFGVVLLGERLGVMQVCGIALVVGGVVLAVLYGGPRDRRVGAASAPRRSRGVLFALIAAAGQAGGALSAQPAMADHVSPFAAMAVRCGVAATILVTISAFRRGGPDGGFSWPAFRLAAAGALIGSGLGMLLLMAALARGSVAVVSTLAAMTPVAVLPMVWWRSGHAPPWQAWIGAALAVAGTALIFLA